jgi:hypothetical protein
VHPRIARVKGGAHTHHSHLSRVATPLSHSHTVVHALTRTHTHSLATEMHTHTDTHTDSRTLTHIHSLLSPLSRSIPFAPSPAAAPLLPLPPLCQPTSPPKWDYLGSFHALSSLPVLLPPLSRLLPPSTIAPIASSSPLFPSFPSLLLHLFPSFPSLPLLFPSVLSLLSRLPPPTSRRGILHSLPSLRLHPHSSTLHSSTLHSSLHPHSTCTHSHLPLQLVDGVRQREGEYTSQSISHTQHTTTRGQCFPLPP